MFETLLMSLSFSGFLGGNGFDLSDLRFDGLAIRIKFLVETNKKRNKKEMMRCEEIKMIKVT